MKTPGQLSVKINRPRLSKGYLSGEIPFERLLIKRRKFWERQNVSLITGSRVISVHPDKRSVCLDDGTMISYRHLVWAAGAHPRRLPCQGHDLAGVHSFGSRADVDRMRDELDNAHHVVIVGAGCVGLEAASEFAQAGKNVTVLETQDRVLSRVGGIALSSFYEAQHRARGVDLRLGVGVDSLLGQDRVTGVRLADGSTVAADMVIVSIGSAPSIEPLKAAGASCADGVGVNPFGETSLPQVYAIGDCALHWNVFSVSGPIRVESVQNAKDMAVAVADTIRNIDPPFSSPPLFWSRQYDLRLQVVGLSVGHDQEVVRGDPASRSFSVAYLHEGRLIAFACVNAPNDYVVGKQLISNRIDVRLDQLADASEPLSVRAITRGRNSAAIKFFHD